MKKRILLVLLLGIAFSANAQTMYETVELRQVTEDAQADSLLSINGEGEIGYTLKEPESDPNSWHTNGNNIGNNDFIGTTNAEDLLFKVNGVKSGIITSSGSNVGLGYSVFNGITYGFYNTAIGSNVLKVLENGSRNTAIGHNALTSSVHGFYNTAVGANALNTLTYGENNTAIGKNAGSGITSGSGNTIIGANNEIVNGTISNQVIISDGDGNVVFRADGVTRDIDVYGTVSGENAIDQSDFVTLSQLQGQTVQSDWDAVSGDAAILNKPVIPTDNSQIANGAGYLITENQTLSISNDTLIISGGNSVKLPNSGVSSALVQITEGTNTGWIWAGDDRDYKSSDIGNNSLDLSIATTDDFSGASSDESIAIGLNSITNHGTGAIAIGNDSKSFYNSIAIGYKSSVQDDSEDGAIAIGANAFASYSSVSIGTRTNSIGLSVSIGENSKSMQEGVAIGGNSESDNAIAIGTGAKAPSQNSIAIGNSVETKSEGEIVLGNYSTSYTPEKSFGWNLEDRLFYIGSNDYYSHSDALLINKRGEIYAPMLEISEIDAPHLETDDSYYQNVTGANGKILVTKEWVQSQNYTKKVTGFTVFDISPQTDMYLKDAPINHVLIFNSNLSCPTTQPTLLLPSSPKDGWIVEIKNQTAAGCNALLGSSYITGYDSTTGVWNTVASGSNIDADLKLVYRSFPDSGWYKMN